MTAPPRIALLLADTPISSVQEHSGDYRVIYKKWLQDSAPNVDFVLDCFDVVNKLEYPPEDTKYDALVITGSAASAYEDVEWINKLVEYVAHIAKARPHVKLIGACFGHQIIARAFGGECVPNHGIWEIAVTELALTDMGCQIFGAKTLNIQQMHRDHVPAVPPTFHLLGSTPVSLNQGMVRFDPQSEPSTSPINLKDVHVFTVQGHPEFTAPIVTSVVEARSATGAMSAEVSEDALRRVNLKNDGVDVIGKVVWGILGVSV